MRTVYDVREVSREDALEMIQRYHYSNTLPKINKHFLGFYLGGSLVGVMTLGWGTRPLHTIKRIFPSLGTEDYLEIGRMAMTDDMPRNSESQMISQCIQWMKSNLPHVKVLFTWADGMVGKVGYVYQASNFIYAGWSGGEMYMKDGVKLHVRQMKSFLVPEGVKDDRITVRPTLEQMRMFGIDHYRGKQYRYLMFLCDKREKRRLLKECQIDLTLPRPKDDDLSWTVKNLHSGKWEKAVRPPYVTDVDQKTRSIVKMEARRTCNECGSAMDSGFVVYDGEEYYCCNECLEKHYAKDDYESMYADGDAYWTECGDSSE